MNTQKLMISLACCLLIASCTSLDDVEDRLDLLEGKQTDLQRPPRLLSIEFPAENNPRALITDATCTIIGDSVADCFVHNIMDDKQLIPRIAYEGDSVTIGEEFMWKCLG